MRLEIAERVRLHPPGSQHGADQRRLGLAGRQRDAVGPPRAVHPAGEDDAAHRVALGQGGGERLEQQHHAALGPHVAVRAGAEGLAASAQPQHARAPEAAEGKGREQQVHAAHERRRDAAVAQRLAGLVQRDHGGGAGGVHRQGRTAQVEDVAEAIGQDGQRAARHGVAVGGILVLLAQVGPVGGGGAHIGADGLPGDARLRPAGIGQGLAGQRQQEALLGVHLGGLARGDAEAGGVEAAHVPDGARTEMHGAAWLARAGMQVARMVEAIGRHLGHGVAARFQQRAEAVQVGRARQTAGGPDHGDRHAARGGGRLSGAVSQLHNPPLIS
jgi:hypothetical protein